MHKAGFRESLNCSDGSPNTAQHINETKMPRVKLLKNHGNKKAGWVVAVSDPAAAALVAAKTAVIVPNDTPLKKGNLNLYANCTPLPPAKAAKNEKA